MQEGNMDQLPLARPQPGIRPATQTCALTRNQNGDFSLCRMVPNQLSHTSQSFTPHFRGKQTIKTEAVAGVAQWIEFQPANQRVVSLIPSRGSCLGCRPRPQLWL